MPRLALTFLALIATGLLPGCSKHYSVPVTGGADAEEAAIRLESSKREYEDCVKNQEPGEPTCDSLEALYKKDKEAYESSAR